MHPDMATDYDRKLLYQNAVHALTSMMQSFNSATTRSFGQCWQSK